ncbi:recombinase family protein [Klebsiella sp. BIGb0407]|uniref:recombinase family protein n=1 Tax=Klebsiella sp. BIGb0407 TaxID=2940603 RepID=UPI0021688BBA|nr:recombinase family protein [Klebsiella sp. BIGb0407]MCS3430583.1 DNA invertase Pin-like site-specific DNA recombinase [Klebsiella sp. BIGb0407]
MENIGYIRVSTTQQNSDRQLAEVTLNKIFEDQASGKNTDRPAFKDMMSYVRDGDVLHIHSIDRLCRNTADLLNTVNELSNKLVAVKFHKEGFITGEVVEKDGKREFVKNKFGNLMLSIIGAVSQMERETMLERQAEGYQAAKAAGRITGRGKGKSIDRQAVRKSLNDGLTIRAVAELYKISTRTVMNIKNEV